ncbi:MAG: aldo/keto reductase [Bacteroidales bacterium]
MDMSQNNINRRKFLARGITGAAGALVFPKSFTANENLTQEKKIVYRTLGKTGIRVPVVSFGVMRSDSPGLCKAAYENGITFFDTAHGYQGGNNETMLGNIFKDLPRSSFIVETKVKPAGVGRDGLPTAQTTAEDFLDKFNTSLKRLQLDYVDILLIHDVSNPELLNHKPLLSTLTRLKKEKKTKYVGFSTHGNMPAVINAAASSGFWDVIITTYNFMLNNIDEMNQALKNANDAGIGIVAMKTLAGGFMDKERKKPVNATVALKWAISNPNVHTTISGMTSFDHLENNLKVLADPVMTEQEKQELMAMADQPGLFCINCRECLSSCTLNLPVPDLMRAYMYAYGYANLKMAYDLLGELGTGVSPCINCNECHVKCTKGFNVREKITDVSRLVSMPYDLIT